MHINGSNQQRSKENLKRLSYQSSNNIPVDLAILYGSQAKGQARPHSDIDIAVFSHKFKNKSHYTAQVMLQKYLWGIKADIQPVGSPVEEYSSKNKLDFVGGIIKKEGIIVCRKNKILI